MGKLRAAVLGLVCTSGCAWVFQEHLPTNYEVSTHEPRCSTAVVWQVLDGVFGTLSGLTALGELTIDNRTDLENATLTFAAAWVVVHTASLVTGNRWASECEQAQGEFDANEHSEGSGPQARRRRIDRAEPERDEPILEQPNEAQPERRVLHGEKPLFCTVKASDTERGSCFFDQATCDEASKRGGEALSRCASRNAAACFNSSRVLDDQRVTVCSVSVKDCEAQRTERANDPDFTKVSADCGVYRFEAPQPEGESEAPSASP